MNRSASVPNPPVTLCERVDHDRWRVTGSREVVRVPGEPQLVLHGVEYVFSQDGRVLSARRLEWSDALRRSFMGLSSPDLMTPESIMENESVLPQRRVEIRKWAEFKPIPVPPLVDAIRRGSVVEMHAAVWRNEILDAMKRHRCVWIRREWTKNAAVIKEKMGIRHLHDTNEITTRGENHEWITFEWAASQLRAAFGDSMVPTCEYDDDFTVDPTEDLGCLKGDLAARVDAFIDRKRVCNTMLRNEVVWRATNPWNVGTPKTESAMRYKLSIYLNRAETERALFVCDTDTVFISALDSSGNAVHAKPHPAQSTMLTLDGTTQMTCVAAQTKLRSVCVRRFSDLLRVPRDARFTHVYMAVDLTIEEGWIREASRFAKEMTLIHIL